jgi:hypothetical protein
VTGEWNLKVGTEVTRAEVAERYGGSKFGGIEPSGSSRNVFLYSDLSAGRKYGYNFDGWGEDGEVYFYTGEGPDDQALNSGNKAIAEHLNDKRALRLFEATGRSRRPGGKIHRYIGRFEIDPYLPYVYDIALGPNGMRTVIVFRLLPVGKVWRADDEATPLLTDVPDSGHSRMVPVERADATKFARPATKGSTAARKESLLTARYQGWLEEQGHEVVRWSIRLSGARSPLYTDIYDVQDEELYEAKGTVKRADVRMAIGQLFDYRRHIDVVVPRLTVLLPERPTDDLVLLINSCGMNCVYATGLDTFDRVDS